MKLKFTVFLCVFFTSSFAIADGGVDVFKTTQSSEKDSLEISCTSSFEAPYDNLYTYESVWNWALFGGYFSWVPVKVGEKYTGEFRYTGMNCTAKRDIFNATTQQYSPIELKYYFGADGQLTIISSSALADVSIDDYRETFTDAQSLFTISNLIYDVNQAGSLAAFISDFLSESLVSRFLDAAAMSVIAKLASESVFIYFEQNEIKQQISNFMNNEAANTTKEVAERLVSDVIQLEDTYRFIVIMPAINSILL